MGTDEFDPLQGVWQTPSPEPIEDPERAALVLVLLALLTLVPATMGKFFLVNMRGWPRLRARILAFGIWIVTIVLVAWKLLG